MTRFPLVPTAISSVGAPDARGFVSARFTNHMQRRAALATRGGHHVGHHVLMVVVVVGLRVAAAPPASSPVPSQHAVDRRGHPPAQGHEFLELFEGQRLVAVAQGRLRVGMDLDNQAVGAAATAAAAIRATKAVWPVPWLGSTTTGRCVRSCK